MSHSSVGSRGVSFSWRRAVGLSSLQGKVSRKIGVPLSRSGRQRKMGRIAFKLVLFLLAVIAALAVALWAKR